MKINKIAIKNDISIEIAKKAILINHEYKHFYKKNELVEIKVNMDIGAIKLIKKISKALKVDENSVFVAFLTDFLEKQNEQK